ncbi:sulfite exporter TauE/SafE family protein [Desulfuribacillus alkaliarsenatis]|uniref:Probable membrane transporter protein n=1 Tax=Desulfuribacillus alkaliarsenatis TaxID=766136 RepID=A0A1E5G0Q9_9FIRM|nr:sulfite exporter TauE/SafE family protein [Desulfuribacillus alkaliarsenatis]OEF96498.1 hypothetical protein BHF68_07530 [Desulfuribacillus alkaliarsenatis]
MEESLILIAIGIVAGIVGSIAGIGGGIIIVPALIEIFNAPSQHAAGTSLVVIVAIAFASTMAYAKQQRIDYRSALLFITASAPGAFLGAYIGKQFSEEAFTTFFGILMILLFLFLSLDHKKQKSYGSPSIKRDFIDSVGKSHSYSFNRTISLIVAFCVGLISSLFGIGGGALMVPAMIMLFSFPIHIATATSMLIILVSAIVGSFTHMALGHVIWSYVLLLAPGAYIGGVLGARVAIKLRSNNLIYFLRLVILVVALRMIFI